MDLQAKIRGKRNISHFHSHLLAEMDLQAKIRGKRNISHFHLRLLKEIDGTLSLTFPVTRSKPFTDPECDTDTRASPFPGLGRTRAGGSATTR